MQRRALPGDVAIPYDIQLAASGDPLPIATDQVTIVTTMPMIASTTRITHRTCGRSQTVKNMRFHRDGLTSLKCLSAMSLQAYAALP